MNCIIVDDDASARLIIRKLCEATSSIIVKEEFSSAIDAIKFLNSHTIDLILLDIHMPGFSGFDFIKTLKNSPKIILTTSDKNFALEAFEYSSVVDYLVKPIKKDRFKKSIEKLLALSDATKIEPNEKETTSNKNTAYIFVSVDRRLVKIHVPEILYIEAKGDYISIKTNDKNFIVHSTLKNIQDKLPTDVFLKIHRSYVINITEIIDIEDNSVLIRKTLIPISRANKSELMKRLNLL
ncbi:LytTR family DNA-binding domain-containing protein [Polaribacter sp.]|nr:LytTR family DNA-binding domain-containing protein [Polaribacter sp.]